MLTDNTDWQEARELVTESYRILAPKKLTRVEDDIGDRENHDRWWAARTGGFGDRGAGSGMPQEVS